MVKPGPSFSFDTTRTCVALTSQRTPERPGWPFMPDDRSDGASTIANVSPADVQYSAVLKRKFALIVVGPVSSRATAPLSPANSTTTQGGAAGGRSMKIACVCCPRTGSCTSSPEYAGSALTIVHTKAHTGTAIRSSSFRSLSLKLVTADRVVDFLSRVLQPRHCASRSICQPDKECSGREGT
jgi:hypothetical protein